MSKRKNKDPETTPIPQTQKVEVIPPDLKLQWDSVMAVATAFTCVDKGYFPHSYAKVVKESLKFLASLHGNMVEKCAAHPQAHMIPELKALKKESETQIEPEQASNGEEKAAN